MRMKKIWILFLDEATACHDTEDLQVHTVAVRNDKT
jgi:hypothetical protein